MAVTQPPKKQAADEKVVKQFIKRGQAASAAVEKLMNTDREFRTIKITMLETEGQAIDELRKAWPAPRGSKKEAGISQHDWVILAIQEKIGRDKK